MKRDEQAEIARLRGDLEAAEIGLKAGGEEITRLREVIESLRVEREAYKISKDAYKGCYEKWKSRAKQFEEERDEARKKYEITAEQRTQYGNETIRLNKANAALLEGLKRTAGARTNGEAFVAIKDARTLIAKYAAPEGAD